MSILKVVACAVIGWTTMPGCTRSLPDAEVPRLAHHMTALVNKAKGHVRHNGLSQLEQRASDVRRHLWNTLRRHADDLMESSRQMGRAGAAWVDELRRSLEVGRSAVAWLLIQLPLTGAERADHHDDGSEIGFGKPRCHGMCQHGR